MKCWSCSQPVYFKQTCYRLPNGTLQWMYGCVACHTAYIAQQSTATGPLGIAGILTVRMILRDRPDTLRIGEPVVSHRDPIADAERTGDMILRSPG